MKMTKIMFMSLIAVSIIAGCDGQATKEHDERIIGTWAGYLVDSTSGQKMSPMAMEFTRDGQANYTLDPGTEMQNAFSVIYWTKDNYIHTKNKENNEEEKSKYQIDGNKLIITSGNVTNEFVKHVER